MKYVVEQHPDGTYTVTATRPDGSTWTQGNYIYESSARSDGLRVSMGPPRELTGYGSGSERRSGWRR